MKKVVWSELTDTQKKKILQRPFLQNNAELSRVVSDIVNSVKEGGDKAVQTYNYQFNQIQLDDLRIKSEVIAGAYQKLEQQSKQAIDTAYQNISRFHVAQGYKPYEMQVTQGVQCARAIRPIEKVGLYVPGGTAPLVSTTLMLGIPSQIAGCKKRVMCTPANAQGAINPHILYAAHLCGIEDIFCIGGAQAIAAMAYGTQTVPKVNKIFGPGNAYVTQAKKMVSEDAEGAALDMPAGPSEVCVIADQNTNPSFAAADLLAQAEHDVLSQVMLITPNADKADEISMEVERQIKMLPRMKIAREALNNSFIVICHDISQAIYIANLYGPEHLILCFDDAQKYVSDIYSAGSVFVGPWATEAAGDYCSGTNHVLPTYGYAHNYSGLSVEAFQRTMTVQTISREGIQNLGPVIETLARIEGLEAHARASMVRTLS